MRPVVFNLSKTSVYDKLSDMTRAAFYSRVSTGHQDSASQLDAMRSFAVARKLTLAAEFNDDDESDCLI